MTNSISKTFFTTLSILIGAVLHAQEFDKLYNKILSFKEPYQFDEVDCEIIEATDYLLSLCYEEDRYIEDLAYLSMIKWMQKTSVYHIIDGGKIKDNCKKNSVLHNISKISMTKYLFQNDSIVQNNIGAVRYVNLHRVREIIHGGAEIFMDYLNLQEKETLKNNVNKELRKGLKMYNEGKLEKFMDYK